MNMSWVRALADSGLFHLGALAWIFVLERILALIPQGRETNWLFTHIFASWVSLISVWSHATSKAWLISMPTRTYTQPFYLSPDFTIGQYCGDLAGNLVSHLIAIVVSKLEAAKKNSQAAAKHGIWIELSKEQNWPHFRSAASQPHIFINRLKISINALDRIPSHKKPREMVHSAFEISFVGTFRDPQKWSFGFGKSWPISDFIWIWESSVWTPIEILILRRLKKGLNPCKLPPLRQSSLYWKMR